jgi:hypothetical protein
VNVDGRAVGSFDDVCAEPHCPALKIPPVGAQPLRVYGDASSTWHQALTLAAAASYAGHGSLDLAAGDQVVPYGASRPSFDAYGAYSCVDVQIVVHSDRAEPVVNLQFRHTLADPCGASATREDIVQAFPLDAQAPLSEAEEATACTLDEIGGTEGLDALAPIVCEWWVLAEPGVPFPDVVATLDRVPRNEPLVIGMAGGATPEPTEPDCRVHGATELVDLRNRVACPTPR